MLPEANIEINMSSVQLIYLVMVVGILSFIGGVHTKDVIDRINNRKNK